MRFHAIVLTLGMPLLVLVICCSGRQIDASVPTPAKMNLTLSSTGTFQLEIPDKWVFQEKIPPRTADPTLIAVLSFPSYPIGVGGDIRASQEHFDELSAVASWGESVYEAGQITSLHTDYKTSYLKSYAIGNQDTLIREFSYTTASPLSGSINVNCIDNYRIEDQLGYILRFCASEKDFAILEPTYIRMIESFKVLK